MSLQPTQEVLSAIATSLQKTLEGAQNIRLQGEGELTAYKGKSGFATILLQIASAEQVPIDIRKAAASYFKNYVTRLWDQAGAIPDQEKEHIKAMLPGLLLSINSKLFKLLAAGANVITVIDFPDKWPKLLPDLVEKMQSGDFGKIVLSLKIINGVLKKYRNFTGEDGEAQLAQILAVIQAPVLSILLGAVAQAQSAAGNPDALGATLTAIKLLTGIIYSLSAIDLPEFFEDNMEKWLAALRTILVMDVKHKSLLESDDDDKAGLFFQVQTSIFKVLNLYIERYEEDFVKFLEHFVKDAWGILGKTPNKKAFDPLFTSAIHFLALISRSTFFHIFKDPAVLNDLSEKIIVPNMKLRKDDIEMFEDEPKSYVSRELDESDAETRRGAALELVTGLRKNFEGEITQILGRYVQQLLEESRRDSSKGYYAKDAAIFLITALAVQTKTKDGVLSTNSAVPIPDFYRSEILPLLNSDPSNLSVLQASALNFVISFRRIFNHDDFKTLIPLAVKFLVSKSEAVRSFAAMTIDKLLDVKDRVDNNGKATFVIRFGRQHLQPLLQGTIDALLNACDSLRGETLENHFVVRALDRVLTVAEGDSGPYVVRSVNILGRLLTDTYAKPSNPLFGHHLWECVAACIKHTYASQQDRSSVLDNYETVLFPLFEKILTEAQADAYAPFVFQVMALLIELRGSAKLDRIADLKTRAGTMKPVYRGLLRKITDPVMYESQGNIPALTRLLQAYIEHDPAFIAEKDNMGRVLGVFQRLVSSKVNDWLGLYILQSLSLALPQQALDPYFTEIIKIIFHRLSSSKTMQLLKSFLVYISYYVVAHGPDALIQRINAVQPGIIAMVIKSVWLPTASRISGVVERKTCALAGVRFLTDSSLFLQPPLVENWPAFLKSVVMLMENYVEEKANEIMLDTVDAVDDDAVTSSGFSNLKNASKPEYDLYPAVADTRPLLMQKLGDLSKQNSNLFNQMMNAVDGEVKQVMSKPQYTGK